VSEPLRADARRNRGRVLDAAEAVFSTQGPGASTEEVARRAGVGVGTGFRHFPTKEALLTAVLEARLRRLADEAMELAASADPGTAFIDYFRRVVAASGSKLAIADALVRAGVDAAASVASVAAALDTALRQLLSRAQDAGVIRSDIGLPELLALLAGTSRAVQHATTAAARNRVIDIVIDGLCRPAGAGRPRRA
jgi:AcrR family transcriptional regulator